IEQLFGYDEASVRALDHQLLSLIDEEHLYHIDHFLGSDPAKSIGYADLLARSGRDSLEAEAKTELNSLHNAHYIFQSFGAHFDEVRVHPNIGRIRMSRVVSVFDVGRVLNAQATRSQLIGGIVFGIGEALLEELVYDRTHGQPVTTDLAGY